MVFNATELHALQETKPIAPPAGWIGGKSRIAKKIGERLATIPHILYGEPFVGMGNVFFRRGHISKAEVINDASRDVANFFRILQRHKPQFMDCLKFQIASRAEFERLSRTDPATLTDLERAARFLYLQSLTFGGKVVGRTFGTQTSKPSNFNVHTLAPRLDELSERLSRVVIEELDFEIFLKRYDREYALFYIDPPYYGYEGYYGKELFCRQDFLRLVACLKELKGTFLLSINDHPHVREMFRDFTIEPIETVWQASGTQKPVGELLISP